MLAIIFFIPYQSQILIIVHRFPGSFIVSKTIINSSFSISKLSFFGETTIAIQELFDFEIDIFLIVSLSLIS
ncbi:hypothetical protein GW891_03950 [bacterium]|nr:hypothetical protein [bacterium]